MYRWNLHVNNSIVYRTLIHDYFTQTLWMQAPVNKAQWAGRGQHAQSQTSWPQQAGKEIPLVSSSGDR